MEPTLLVLSTFLIFTSTHVGLGIEPLRGRLVARFGERGFVNFFSAVATLSFAAWIVTTAFVRNQGAPGLGLAALPAVRVVAMGLVGVGFVLASASLASYARSPMALFSNTVREPYGVERITRHALFSGIALFAAAHILLAPTLASVVFFAGLAIHATLGAVAQDRKLQARLGEPYRRYLRQTSGLPFAAIASGRQSLVLREQPWLAYTVGLVLAFGLRQVHAHIFDFGGLWIVGSVVATGAIATWSAERAQQRTGRIRHA